MPDEKEGRDGPDVPENDKVIHIRVDGEGKVTWKTENVVSVYELHGLLTAVVSKLFM
jgi:biopolymer transport protein ExbD